MLIKKHTIQYIVNANFVKQGLPNPFGNRFDSPREHFREDTTG